MNIKKLKFGCLTTVRTGSSRLPNKALLKIRGKRVIDHILERMKSCKNPDLVILATSNQPEDDVLVKIAEQHGVECFRGSAKDRLARMLGAAEKFDLDYIVTFDADDLFCDPELVDSSIKQMLKNPCDVIKSSSGLICGAFTFCISTATLREACRIKDTDNTELYEVYILDNTRFKVNELAGADPILYNDSIRMTLDYPEDFEFFSKVFDELQIDTNTISLKRIVELLQNKPEIAKINLSRHKDYVAKREVMKKATRIKVA